MQAICSFGLFIGRLCLAAIFIAAGVGKFMDYDATAEYMVAHGFTMIPVFLFGAALIELLGGLLLVLGYKTHLGAAILMLFLIPTTYIFHGFWNEGPEMQQLQMIMFLKNLAIFGGLFYVLVAGAGGLSIDRCGCCTRSGK